MADLFGDWVPYEWQDRVFDACLQVPRHTYIFLTKNPRGMEVALKRWKEENHLALDEKAKAFDRWWFGTSAGDRDYGNNYDPIVSLIRVPSKNLFISFEPLLLTYEAVYLGGIRQVIIGAQTKPDKCASLESVLKICEAADRVGAKVFMKDSLAGRWPDRELRRELCWSVHK
jgi:protein gp37